MTCVSYCISAIQREFDKSHKCVKSLFVVSGCKCGEKPLSIVMYLLRKLIKVIQAIQIILHASLMTRYPADFFFSEDCNNRFKMMNLKWVSLPTAIKNGKRSLCGGHKNTLLQTRMSWKYFVAVLNQHNFTQINYYLEKKISKAEAWPRFIYKQSPD